MRYNWDFNLDFNIVVCIMKCVVEVYLELMDGKGIEVLSIIWYGVGLWLVREGGVRIEKEKIDGIWVVYNYGYVGWGY